MPLSEQEQRLLDEMERNLYKHEADIVSTPSGPRTVNYTRVALGIALVAAGLAVVVVGVVVQFALVGVAGFGLAVGGAMVALTASRPAEVDEQGSGASPKGGAAPKAKGRSSLMDRLSAEWDKRQQQ
ncbi:DUF3040 domain-containing protein [Agrococcus sp. SGAir0287]|uniref:DUF3040 domain-containing protein n=1 Tax=Agrococcus sp. SGAir0287 TaxID=2070347 RepID=UPI0010CCDF29|nr:DUF3040 domain-containing protein [Agrococcus sp. SGAir0287]QCR19513.1 DUF3040 domain-containing protein [Agrococcus sp. SGAir0287]